MPRRTARPISALFPSLLLNPRDKGLHFLCLLSEKRPPTFFHSGSRCVLRTYNPSPARTRTEVIGCLMQEGKEPESLDSVILFLKEFVPDDALNAQRNYCRTV